MVPITKVNMPANKVGIKCPGSMTPTRIVIHNTYNDAPAMGEISYMISNGNTTSFHFAVDEWRIVQGIELNRHAWHAGDGRNGTGNRKGIGIEICYSKSGGEKFVASEKNAAELTAHLLKQYGWGMDRVKKHQDFSGKYCPHRTLDCGWDRFLSMVKAYLDGGSPAPAPEPAPEPAPPPTKKYNNQGQRGANPDTSKYCYRYDDRVQELQKILKITADGKAGAKTYAAVKKYTVERNDTGKLIKWTQQRLNDPGYNAGAADGIAGDKTMAAIARFQRAYGLAVGRLLGTDWYYMIES